MSVTTMNYSGRRGLHGHRIFGERIPAIDALQPFDVMRTVLYATGGLVLLGSALHIAAPQMPRFADFISASPAQVATTSAKAKGSLLSAGPVSISPTSAVLKAGPVPGVEPMLIAAGDARPVQVRAPMQNVGPVEFAAAREQVVAFADPRSLKRDPNVFAFFKNVEPVPGAEIRHDVAPAPIPAPNRSVDPGPVAYPYVATR